MQVALLFLQNENFSCFLCILGEKAGSSEVLCSLRCDLFAQVWTIWKAVKLVKTSSVVTEQRRGKLDSRQDPWEMWENEIVLPAYPLLYSFGANNIENKVVHCVLVPLPGQVRKSMLCGYRWDTNMTVPSGWRRGDRPGKRGGATQLLCQSCWPFAKHPMVPNGTLFF